MDKTQIVSPELIPVVIQLQAEGYTVYTYTCESMYDEEINSLYWFENGRVLNIQSSSWKNKRYARDRYNIGVSYYPSRINGTGCGLSDGDIGNSASELLRFRKYPTWVNGIQNYTSIDDFVKRQTVLTFYEIEKQSNE